MSGNYYSPIFQKGDAPLVGWNNQPISLTNNPLVSAYNAAVGASSSPVDGSSNSSPSSTNSSQNFSIDPVVQLFKSKGITLSPDEQTQLSQTMAQNAAKSNLATQYQGLQLAAGLSNDAANSNAQRNLLINSQKYDAENTANQLNSLNQARATSQQGISNAFNTAASMFR